MSRKNKSSYELWREYVQLASYSKDDIITLDWADWTVKVEFRFFDANRQQRFCEVLANVHASTTTLVLIIDGNEERYTSYEDHTKWFLESQIKVWTPSMILEFIEQITEGTTYNLKTSIEWLLSKPKPHKSTGINEYR